MSILSNHINQIKAAEAFSRQAAFFDQIYGCDRIIQYKRKRVREHILQLVPEGSSMLELNCGTGEDALFFAQRNYRVHATDYSEGMMHVLEGKIKEADAGKNITTELCSFTELESLQNRGPFDAIYSNFGGLNCTGDLDKVLGQINKLVRPGGIVTLVIISKFCLWETLLLFKGKFKTAFRRFFSNKGRKAHIEGKYFKCWYYGAAFVKKQLKDFELVSEEGLCTLVPPSYIEGFAEKYLRLFTYLKSKENRLKGKWPWKAMGDYYIISFRKKTD